MSSAINTKGRKCAYNNFKRIRYFHGMLMSDRDFREEQLYHQEKRKLLNRHLHGWGVVCGLGLEIDGDGKYLTVKPGMALDCFGNEILVSEACKLDIEKLLIPDKNGSQNNDPCYEPPAGEQEATYYLGISYGESPSDPVPVYAPPGGCEEKTCEHSRVHEGFCLELLTSCEPPEIYHNSGLFRQFQECEDNPTINGDLNYSECDNYDNTKKCQCNKLGHFCRQPLPCPDCTRDQAAVILGEVTIDRTAGTFTAVAINACRTYVLSSRMLRYISAALFKNLPEQLLQVEQANGGKIPLLSPDCMVANPINAICWLMKHLEIDGGKIHSDIQWFAEDGAAATGALLEEINALRDKMNHLKNKFEAEISTLQTLIQDLQKMIPSAAPAAPAAPTKPASKRSSKKTGK